MFFFEISADLSAQIFFLICVLGLFHGLLVLPVLLALFGPPSRLVGPSSRQQAAPKLNFGKAAAKSSLHQENDEEGDREVDRAHLQQDIQNVETEVTSDEISPLRDGDGEAEQGMLDFERREV